MSGNAGIMPVYSMIMAHSTPEDPFAESIDYTDYKDLWQYTIGLVGELPDPTPYVSSMYLQNVGSTVGWLGADIGWDSDEGDKMSLQLSSTFQDDDSKNIGLFYDDIRQAMGQPEPYTGVSGYPGLCDREPRTSRHPEMQRLFVQRLAPFATKMIVKYDGLRVASMGNTAQSGWLPSVNQNTLQLARTALNLSRHCGRDGTPFRRLLRQLRQSVNQEIPASWTWLQRQPPDPFK